MEPKVSVIVPIYKSEKYLEECLASLTSQSFEPLEIICIDDASPDRSIEIVRSFQDQDQRIRLQRHRTNRGAGTTRNTGIRLATAPHICFVDSDDCVDSVMIENLYKRAVNGSFDIICCGYAEIDEAGSVLARHMAWEGSLNPRATKRVFLITNPAPWSKIWAKRIFIDNGIFFPDNMKYEDLATIPRAIYKASSVASIKDDYYKYRSRPDSIMTTVDAQSFIDFFKAFDILKAFLINEREYAAYKEEFTKLIGIALDHRILKINESGLSDAEKRQSVRHICIMLKGYAQFDDGLRNFLGSQSNNP